nr:GGDEF domain-containing protein [Flavimaribacter sediminis]
MEKLLYAYACLLAVLTLMAATSASSDKWPTGRAFRYVALNAAILASFAVNLAITSAAGIPAAGPLAFHGALILLYVSYPVAATAIALLVAYIVLAKNSELSILVELVPMLGVALTLRVIGRDTYRVTWPVKVVSIAAAAALASIVSTILSGASLQVVIGNFVMTALVVSAGAYFFEREKALRDRRAYWRERAQTDHLTTLYNRSRFERDISVLVENNDVGLLLIDADNFKMVNDRFGHEAGDIALTHISQVLYSELADPQKAYRIGGEEFAVIICDNSSARIVAIAESIRGKIETSSLIVNGQSLKMTVSIGLTLGKKGDSPAEVMRQADKSLYRAKDRGRNCVDVFEEARSAA